MNAFMNPTVKEFFDESTWTLSYIVFDMTTKDGVIIDPVWDYDMAASVLSENSIHKMLSFIKSNNLNIIYILETHAHADHLSGAQVLKKYFPKSKVGIGKHITQVQKVFKKFFNLTENFQTNGQQFDFLIEEKKPFFAGSLKIEMLYTPGHTPACGTYVIGNAVFTGDALFMPDYGTGRCDFPLGSASDLYDSIYNKIFLLPDYYNVFVGHDYLPNGRKMEFKSTILEQKQTNIHINLQTTKESFVLFRQERDKTLGAPKLLLQSVQVNIDAGRLPPGENNNVSYLKIPLQVNT